MNDPAWKAALSLHAEAVNDLARSAGELAPDLWAAPLGPGRWTPAQVVVHLTLSYEALLHELGGGEPMRMRTRAWQRAILRFTLRPRILAGSFFPHGIRSPREVRPPDEAPERAAAVARFRERAGALVAALERARRGGERVRLTHPYLGRMNAAESLRFCAAHIRHHQAQLPAASATSVR